jgi:cellulose synthase/poly-beta-1,6-N-acetylglucosamine synthase-like glycosyltransferase
VTARQAPRGQRSAAVLIAAHNEELVIAATLESILVTYAPEDVFVFDDASTDGTADVAERYLPVANVLRHSENIGKSRGLEHALQFFVYPSGYDFVTIFDADTTMEPEYRERVLVVLEDDRVVCAAGQVKSQPQAGNIISIYRACVYFIWQALFKRLQSAFNAIAIAPGCASTWRVSGLRKIHFDHRMSTEDFHLTMSAHRQRLGRIRYVPGAVVWTQDPLTLGAFIRQTSRWNRAWWEAVRMHRLGLRWVERTSDGRLQINGVDIFNALLMVSMALFFVRFLAMPLYLITPFQPFPEFVFPGGRDALALHLGLQSALILSAVLVAAVVSGRFMILVMAPVVVALMLVEFVSSVKAFMSVARRQFPERKRLANGSGTTDAAASPWKSPPRRSVPLAGGETRPAVQVRELVRVRS